MKKIDMMHLPPTTPSSPTYSSRNQVKGGFRRAMLISKTIAEESSNSQVMNNEQIDTPDIFSSLVKINNAAADGLPINSQVEYIMSYPNTNNTNSPKNAMNLGKNYKN